MTEDTILEPARKPDISFPQAPEDAREPMRMKSTAKKATKKAAKKTAVKKSAEPKVEAKVEVVEKASARKTPAKKAAKKTVRATKEKAVVAEKSAVELSPATPSAPAPAPIETVRAEIPSAPAPVVTHAPVEQPVAHAAPPVATTAPAEVSHASSDSAAAPRAGAGSQQHAPHQSREPHQKGEGQPQEFGRQRHGKWGRRDRFRDRDRHRDGQPREGQERPPQQEAPPERPLGPPEPSEGILELTPKGYGFLRQKSRLFAQFAQDPWVSPEFIRNLGLREGMFIKGVERMGHRGPQVMEITEINGQTPETIRNLPLFEELKAVNPNKRIQLETRSDRLTTRVMDLITPVGRGQRGLIVAPPRAGKTTLLQHIAEAVATNHPQMHLMILLIDERPEEVTEFRKTLPTAEIHASSNDSDTKTHLRTAAFAIERAKRLVEAGQHVFLLLDSITRMGRAFNNAQKGGATMSGGVGVGALEMPRRLFAAARNTRDAGSLTILATALIETGSRMDELIFQEFKGTGNLELVLDRKIAEQYIYPAVNIFRSGTRREELLLPPFQMEKVHMLRRGLAGHKPMEAIQRVISLMERYPNNSQMLIDLPGKAG